MVGLLVSAVPEGKRGRTRMIGVDVGGGDRLALAMLGLRSRASL
jgi:hypothetical protein